MKRMTGILLALVILLAAGCAAAEQRISLPESSLTLALPDEMICDGPTPGSDEAFAYVSNRLGLEISFFRYNDRGRQLADLIPGIREKGADEVRERNVGGMDMIVYRIAPYDASGMKCIGYILKDGDAIQEIVFWYATQSAADRSEAIMGSIQ